ncbi:MAG TPA: TIM barrel protein [Steroidobacteraceae bacterium]|nr:TIM barrel protein [Steroidobacteraceae bacterium]
MLNFSANLSVMFRELPFLERFAAARAGGFRAVEIQVPYDLPIAALARAADEAGLPIVLINAPMGPDRAPGMACRPEHRAPFRASLHRAAEYAHALCTPNINVLAGRAAPHERSVCLQQLAEHLSLAAEVFAPSGARALLEPINPLDVPDYCVSSFELARGVLAACDSRVQLQFDVYHAARLGLEPDAAFQAVRDRVAHVQFADCPGRHEPGTGTLPFSRIFGAIDRSGFDGWIGAEYHPSGSRTADSLAWLRQPWVRSFAT